MYRFMNILLFSINNPLKHYQKVQLFMTSIPFSILCEHFYEFGTK